MRFELTIMNSTKCYNAKEIRDLISDKEVIAKPVFVVGSGFYLESGLDTLSWKGFLLKIAENLDVKLRECGVTGNLSSFINEMYQNQDLTYLELYDWLLLKYEDICRECNIKKENGKILYSSKKNINPIIEKTLNDELDDRQSVASLRLLNWCIGKSCPILTTNFDSHLVENDNRFVFKHSKEVETETDTFPVGSCYHLKNEEICSEDRFYNSFSFWNINGSFNSANSKNSPRFSLRDYQNYAGFLFNNGKNYIYDENYTWIKLFRDGNLIFTGISLDSQEMLLRRMLIERKRYFYGQNKEVPKSYYINFNKFGCKSMSLSKKEFFKDLGIETLELQCGEKLSEVFQKH